MKIFSEKIGGDLFISLSGELDHHATRTVIPEISQLIDRELPTTLTLDFRAVSFMDSSGIAVVIGAFKRANSISCDFSVINVSVQSNKIFTAAGLQKVISIKECEKIPT